MGTIKTKLSLISILTPFAIVACGPSATSLSGPRTLLAPTNQPLVSGETAAIESKVYSGNNLTFDYGDPKHTAKVEFKGDAVTNLEIKAIYEAMKGKELPDEANARQAGGLKVSQDLATGNYTLMCTIDYQTGAIIGADGVADPATPATAVFSGDILNLKKASNAAMFIGSLKFSEADAKVLAGALVLGAAPIVRRKGSVQLTQAWEANTKDDDSFHKPAPADLDSNTVQSTPTLTISKRGVNVWSSEVLPSDETATVETRAQLRFNFIGAAESN